MKDILRDVVSLWGTADAGVIGCETALSVTVRRWLAARPEVGGGRSGEWRTAIFLVIAGGRGHLLQQRRAGAGLLFPFPAPVQHAHTCTNPNMPLAR